MPGDDGGAGMGIDPTTLLIIVLLVLAVGGYGGYRYWR